MTTNPKLVESHPLGHRLASAASDVLTQLDLLGPPGRAPPQVGSAPSLMMLASAELKAWPALSDAARVIQRLGQLRLE